MDAVTYLKEKARLTQNCTLCTEEDCKLEAQINGLNIGCTGLEIKHPETSVEIIEKWSKDCPAETYKDVFLKAFPKADIDVLCINEIFGMRIPERVCHHTSLCGKCWDEPYKIE